MPVTVLDPNTALIVVDLQMGVLGLPAAHPLGGILERAATLARAFRRRNLPVVLVNVAGGAPGRAEWTMSGDQLPAGWTDLAPQLDPQPGDLRVTKYRWGAFSAPELADLLQGRGVTQVVIAGVATSVGVESTARQAHELGFNVTLAVDAMTDQDPEAHRNSVARIFPRLGETGTTDEILALLGAPRA